MVSPTPRAPCRVSSPATTELSTPPDIATATGASVIAAPLGAAFSIDKTMLRAYGSSKPGHTLDNRCPKSTHVLTSLVTTERETNTRARFLPAESHAQQHR